MRSIRCAVAVLVVCLVLGCLSPMASAWELSQIQVGDTISVAATKEDHIRYYEFIPQTTGTYVLYDLGDCGLENWLSVYTASPEDAAFEQALAAKGLNQVIFQAEAGVACWLKLECGWIGGMSTEHSFRLDLPTQPESISIGYTKSNSNFVGSTGILYLHYSPMGSGVPILWETSDPNVVTVAGDSNGCTYTLTGPGKATITANGGDGLTAAYQVEALDIIDLSAGASTSVTMSGTGYVSSEKHIRFTAEESGPYALSVSYADDQDIWHGVEMSMGSGSGYIRSDSVLRFEAQAGKTYTIDVDLWGMYDRPVTYTFQLLPCVAADGIQLVTPTTMGYIGSSLTVEVLWSPSNSLVEPLLWCVSDDTVAQIKTSDDGSALVRLLAEGTVTLTAETAQGLSASLELTVCPHPGVITLTGGVNPSLTMLANDYFDLEFTPDATGYYRFTTSQEEMRLQFDGPTVVRDGEKLYYLQAGTTYTGGIDNLSDQILEGNVTVSLVEVPAPVSMTITRLPNQTEFLPGALDGIWMNDLLAGMEITVTWSDGRITVWAFDTHGTTYEGYQVRWQLKSAGTNQKELVIKLGDISASCKLTIKNLSVVSLTLVDADRIQIIENSCGYYDTYSGSWIYSEYLPEMYTLLITFNDGSSVTARAGDTVYGKRLSCQMDQYDKPWVAGGENFVTFSYGKLSVRLPVEIIESPVEKIQLLSKPRTVFTIGDRRFFMDYGDGVYYFAPENLKQYLEGLSFKIYYKDGTQKIVSEENIQWRQVSGKWYPYVDGYPLGLMGELMSGYDPISQECEMEGLVEFMGASVTYTVYLVEPTPGSPETADDSLNVPLLLLPLTSLTLCIVIKKRRLAG